MKSGLAKVLHEIAGRPLLGHVIHVAETLAPSRLLTVVGRDAEQVQERFAGRSEFVLQAEQNGTGHAVLQTESKLRDFDGDILVLYGDTPLLRAETLQHMRAYKRETGAEMVLLSALGPIPGRIVRDGSGHLARIVEQQDATPEELAIPERNTGVYLVDSSLLWHGLASIDDDNQQGELYLTDVAGIAVSEGRAVEVLQVEDADEALGINTRAELAQAGAVMRRRIALRHMAEGVTFVDPEQTYVDADVKIGREW
jgi:bifunctional UDP-N-acetylglucosamine pyrophosphorylase/glucosamine-1-phosphate N-acetyltransferase